MILDGRLAWIPILLFKYLNSNSSPVSSRRYGHFEVYSELELVKLSLCLIKHCDVETYIRGRGGVVSGILTSEIDGVEWLGSRPGRFILAERAFRPTE
jgi:hypothetical protein